MSDRTISYDQNGRVICDCQDEYSVCDYQQKDKCCHMPLAWGKYCSYEVDFINRRYGDLIKVYNAMSKFYRDRLGLDGFWLNHTRLWEVCFIYANDLKPIRQFHDIQGGCDQHRRAALIARLISNHRPIFIHEFQIPDSKEKQNDRILKINEHFSLHAMMHFLEIDGAVFSLSGMEKTVAELLFIFGHRDPQPESLICIARLIRNISLLYENIQGNATGIP